MAKLTGGIVNNLKLKAKDIEPGDKIHINGKVEVASVVDYICKSVRLYFVSGGMVSLHRCAGVMVGREQVHRPRIGQVHAIRLLADWIDFDDGADDALIVELPLSVEDKNG